MGGGKYSEYHTYVLFNLLFAMDIRPEFFEPIDRDGDGLPDILNHAMWGCGFMMKMQMNNGSIFHEVEKIEVTDGIVGNNDDRPISGLVPVHNGLLAVASMAGTSALIKDQQPEVADRYLQGALRSFGSYHPMVSGGQGSSVDTAAAVMACLQLHRATGNSTYIELAEHYCDLALVMDYSTYYGPFVPCALGYYLELNPSTGHSQRIKDYIIAHADNRISSDTAPDDELRPFDIPSVRNYIMDPEAAPALFAYEYTGNISYLEYGLGILDFHLGKNPYGICMLEGTGTRNVPGYANDYQLGHATDSPYAKANPDNPGGAHPGAIPQGIVMREGRPFYETSMNPGFQFGETWLINTHFLQPIVLVPKDTWSYPLEVDETPLVSMPFLVILCLILFHESVVHPGEAY